MLARTYELGGGIYRENIFDEILAGKEEEIINFFGEEYRDIITKKAEEANYIIVHRYHYDQEAQEKLDKFINEFIASHFGSTDAINNAYYPGGTLTKQQVIETIISAREMSEPSKDVVNIIIASITKGKPLTEDAKQTLYTAFIADNMFQIQIRSYIANDLRDYINLKRQIELQEKYERLYSLDEREDAVRTCMEQVFGDDVKKIKYDPLDDISTIYLSFYKLKNKNSITIEQIQTFTEVFNQLTKQNLQYGDYLSDREFLQKLDKLNALIEEKFKELERKEKKESPNLRAPFRNLANILEEYNTYDWKNNIVELGKYITHICNCGAYCQDKVDLSEKTHLSLVIMQSDLYGMTHEMLHAISSNGKSYYSYDTGFKTEERYRAFNEVITELFNCIINEYDLINYSLSYTNPDDFNSYSSAFPILQKYVLKHLDDFKKWYITNDINSVKQLMGEKFEPLCDALTKLLALADNKGYTAHVTKRYLEHPDECEDKELLNLLNECVELMKDIIDSVDPYSV